MPGFALKQVGHEGLRSFGEQDFKDPRTDLMKKQLFIALLSGSLLLAGCGDSNNDFVFTNPNNPIPPTARPVCADDAYTTNQNSLLTVSPADGVLANDQPNGGTLTFQATSTNGGTIAGNADGSFTYTPPTNFSGTDSFTYTVTNSAGSATCTVTITVIAVNGFFVDSVNGNDATGSFTGGLPFQTIQAAAAAAPAGSDIVVRPGNYTGTINLENGDRLLGSGSALVNPQGATRPVLTGPVVLADGNTLDFLRIDGTTSDAVDGEGQANGTVTNCEISNITGPLGSNSGIEFDGATGTWNISNNTITNAAGLGVEGGTNGSGTLTVTVNNNMITNCGLDAIGFVSENTSQCTAQVHGNVMTGNQANFTFEVIVGNTATFCLDLENNQNDDVYVLSNSDTGSVLNVEELVIGPPHSIPNNTGTVEIDMGGGFSDPTSRTDGFCGF